MELIYIVRIQEFLKGKGFMEQPICQTGWSVPAKQAYSAYINKVHGVGYPQNTLLPANLDQLPKEMKRHITIPDKISIK